MDLIQTLQLDPTQIYDFVTPAVDSARNAPAFTLDGLLASALTDRADLTAAKVRVDAANEALATDSASMLRAAICFFMTVLRWGCVRVSRRVNLHATRVRLDVAQIRFFT